MDILEIIEKKQLNKISDVACEASRYKWDSIAKPLNSLGEFEAIINRIAAIRHTDDFTLDKSLVYVFAADNGIVEEGISQAGQDVTAICARGIASGKHSVALMANKAGVELRVVDVGISDDVSDCYVSNDESDTEHKILNRRVRSGSRNFAREAAMTEAETVAAMETGLQLVISAADNGYELICLGEMGIGNTTTSTAVACSLLGLRAEEITGRGAGLDDRKLSLKKEVIQTAIDKYKLYEADALTVLQTVGGYDIAAMVGAYIGGAVSGLPIVMDGVIASVAALVANRLLPGVRDYIIPSHMSGEPAMKKIVDELGLNPVIVANMSLGEGTGAVLMVDMLKNVIEVYNHAARFEEREITPYRHFK